MLHSLKENVRVFAQYISSKANKGANLLSRLRIVEFKRWNPNHDVNPTVIPEEIWPFGKIWVYSPNKNNHLLFYMFKEEIIWCRVYILTKIMQAAATYTRETESESK